MFLTDSFHGPGEEKKIYPPPAGSIPSYVNLDWWKTLGIGKGRDYRWIYIYIDIDGYQ